MAMKSSGVSVYQGEMAGDAENLLKGQHTKFQLQPLTLGSSRGRVEWTSDAWGESEAGGSGERTEGTEELRELKNCQDLCAEPILHTAGAVFLRQSNPLQVASA